jgi:hypothetical protein
MNNAEWKVTFPPISTPSHRAVSCHSALHSEFLIATLYRYRKQTKQKQKRREEGVSDCQFLKMEVLQGIKSIV